MRVRSRSCRPASIRTSGVPRPSPRPSDAPLVVGWIGTPTTTPVSARAEADVFADVAQTHDFVLRVSGSMGPVEIPGVRVENVPWTLAGEVELFNTCDIGVYPLPDDEWTRGKCGFKAIQFMACGVPVIAAPVGVNREIVTRPDRRIVRSQPGRVDGGPARIARRQSSFARGSVRPAGRPLSGGIRSTPTRRRWCRCFSR